MDCIVCQNSGSEFIYPDLLIKKCSCGHIFFDPDEKELDLDKIYSKEYFSGEEYYDYVNDKKTLQRNFKKRLKVLLKYQSKGALLEIGSAYGFFLELAKPHFEVKGYELCDEACTYAREKIGLNVTHGDFCETVAEDSPTYDVACLFDCIEHILRPDLLVGKIHKNLKTGAHLILTTGDISRLVPKIKGKKWRLIHPPSHIHYFSRQSMVQLLESQGFEVLKANYPGFWRSFRQILFSISGNTVKLKKLPGAIYMNTYDIMEVVAVKK